MVRLIFNLYVDGYGLSKIAHHLESEQILSPSAYFGRFREGSAAAVNPYHWSPQTISNILSKPEYCGDTVNFRTEKPSYKSKRILSMIRRTIKFSEIRRMRSLTEMCLKRHRKNWHSESEYLQLRKSLYTVVT